MIRIFGNYFDKNGNKYKVVSFNGDRYACESFRTGQVIYLKPNELFTKMPAKPEKVNFIKAIKRESAVEKKSETETTLEPEYEIPVYEEPVYENKDSSLISKEEVLKDNIEETANNDFYADF